MTIVKQNAADHGFNRWTLNGQGFSMDNMTPMFTLHQGKRYRLRFRNASDDIHPLHLHRHSFELTRVGGKPTAGVIKDVVMLGGFQEVEMDFVVDNPVTRCSTVTSNCTWISGSWHYLSMRNPAKG
jgi:FtsP/CotA-like multicopper oxidase with cupredoxin domain